MSSPNEITTDKALTSLFKMTINPSHVCSKGKTLIIKLIDGVWNLPHITSPLSGFMVARNKAADCLSRLVKPTSTTVNMLRTSSTDGPAFHTRSHTQNTVNTTSTPHTDTTPQISQEPTTTPKPLTADHLDTLLQMQRTDPFCKYISRRLLNGKAPHHEFDTFTHVKGLLYKHITDAGKKFLTLVIPKSWKSTVLVEAHDKLGHQGNAHMYCLIKCQYY